MQRQFIESLAASAAERPMVAVGLVSSGVLALLVQQIEALTPNRRGEQVGVLVLRLACAACWCAASTETMRRGHTTATRWVRLVLLCGGCVWR